MRVALKWVPLILAVTIIYLLNLSLSYFDDVRQYIIGWAGLAILVLTFKLQVFKRPPWRFIFIIV
jgi:hypothetical protein